LKWDYFEVYFLHGKLPAWVLAFHVIKLAAVGGGIQTALYILLGVVPWIKGHLTDN